MLIFNPKRMLKLREIEKPHAALVKAGISPATASKFLNYYCISVTVSHIEAICEMLYCTPNDLFDWKPNEKSPLAEDHPLHTLKRTQKLSNIREMLKDMPVEKLAEIENVIENLRKE
ncbi:MAG TPA: helix-turn-helix transcriptional regulator [Pyrinomonadaceae bacterium]|nr:helix-turn-helix transcriptional regulator [Pyrinomonadaceae bacterium]